VVKWLWELAEASQPRDGAVCIVVHGMFIDILCKQLAGAPMSIGKQRAMFCTNNAGVHAFELLVAPEGNIAGMLRFNQVDHVPVELQTGGSVDGLDECYMNEGSA
jgi:2,3-bisphosphoglycerate-dependent phosphoglycerate mutase